MNTFKQCIDSELKYQKNLVDLCRKQIKTLPQGSLGIDRKNGKDYYKIYNHGSKMRALPSDPLVAKLKERRLLEEIGRITEQNVNLLEEMKSRYQIVDPFQIRRDLPKSYEGIPDTVIFNLGFMTLEEFHARFQTDDQYRFSQRIHTLSSGVKVRSRIEVSIAEIYLARGIEFVYEPVVYLGKNVIHPDFAIFVKSSGKIMLHEHVGNLADEKYRQYYEWKMNLYTKNGIVPLRDIVFTYENENGTLDMRALEKMISVYLV